MIYERFWSLIRGANESNKYTLQLFKISLKRVQETSRLQMFRGCAYGQSIVLNDISQAVSIRSDGTEAEQA
jgi:hypothetical protein